MLASAEPVTTPAEETEVEVEAGTANTPALLVLRTPTVAPMAVPEATTALGVRPSICTQAKLPAGMFTRAIPANPPDLVPTVTTLPFTPLSVVLTLLTYEVPIASCLTWYETPEAGEM